MAGESRLESAAELKYSLCKTISFMKYYIHIIYAT